MSMLGVSLSNFVGVFFSLLACWASTLLGSPWWAAAAPLLVASGAQVAFALWKERQWLYQTLQRKLGIVSPTTGKEIRP